MKFNSRYKKTGWFNDSHRHSLAAKGIKTSFARSAPFMNPEQRKFANSLQKSIDQAWERKREGSTVEDARIKEKTDKLNNLYDGIENEDELSRSKPAGLENMGKKIEKKIDDSVSEVNTIESLNRRLDTNSQSRDLVRKKLKDIGDDDPDKEIKRKVFSEKDFELAIEEAGLEKLHKQLYSKFKEEELK